MHHCGGGVDGALQGAPESNGNSVLSAQFCHESNTALKKIKSIFLHKMTWYRARMDQFNTDEISELPLACDTLASVWTFSTGSGDFKAKTQRAH